MSEDTMRLREELSEQMRALQELKEMAASHGFDISKPATNRKKHSNGYTSHTLQRLKNKTELQ